MELSCFIRRLPWVDGRPASEGWVRALGLAYVVLTPLNIRLAGPVFAQDLLAPVFLIALLTDPGARRAAVRLPGALLTVFLCLAAVTTVSHLRGAKDLYELCIFLYMGVLYLFFAQVRLCRRALFVFGLATLVVFCLYAAGEALLGVRATYQIYEDATLGFMAKRFFFTFVHPNLAGSFYVLPVSCVLLFWSDRASGWSAKGWVLHAAVLALLCVPLALTVSRHMLLTVALVLGFLCTQIAGDSARRRLRVLCVCVLLGVFGVFYLTILFPFFPLSATFPFLNHETLGMYTIHQEIYLKMLARSPGAFWFGLGKTGVVETYPQFVDLESTRAILAQYRNEFLTGTFTTYMDAHSEYLNLATAFGVVATACCFAFWGTTVGMLRRQGRQWDMLVFYVLGVLLACMWDDLLSKRWVWVTLGLLVNPLDRAMASAPGGECSTTRDVCADVA